METTPTAPPVEGGETPLASTTSKTTLGRRNILLLVIAIVLFALGGYALFHSKTKTAQATEAYTLVPEKVSESAAISVKLPEDITFAAFNPAQSVHFSPEIKGKWAETPTPPNDGVYKFLPETKLPVGAYYLASLEAPEIRLEKMFSVEKDPTVLAVFPKQEAEVGEFANITVMFSRPMVPLGTLDAMADVTPPVTITPPTQGRWKWITTRTLQFTPETRLTRASHYKVEIRDGFTSLDGVATPPFVHEFTTRTLKYQYGGEFSNALNVPTITHYAPIRVYFNLPFDLDRTIPMIKLKDQSGRDFPFVASYGTRSVWNEKSKKYDTLSDHATLEVYPAQDAHGRKFLWDFSSTYQLSLTGAIPSEGDITLAETRTTYAHTEDVITSVVAASPRSPLVTTEMFDATGTLTFHMSEPVDLSHSSISGKGITKIVYDEKCKDTEADTEISADNCEKVPDQQILIVSFDASRFGMNETSSVIFSKLQNTEGVELNAEPITKSFTTYKKFELYSTTPSAGATKAKLDELTLCTSVPLTAPSDEDFYKKIKSNMMIGAWNWYGSFLVYPNMGGNSPCAVGTFQTSIHYGLVPNYDYKLSLSLDDQFGQHLDKSLTFTTGDSDPLDKGFSHLQPQVLMTPPERTKLGYGLDFMNAMDMTVCKVSAETMLSYRINPPDISTSAEGLNCSETKSKHLVLPQSYATRKYLQVDLADYFTDTLGNYVVVFSNPDYRRVISSWNGTAYKTTLGEQIYEKTFITVTNLAVASKEIQRTDRNAGYYRRDNDDDTTKASTEFMADKWPTNLYWVNDVHALTAKVGLSVTPYATTPNGVSLIKLDTKSTNSEGIAETPSADNIAGAVVHDGADSAVITSHSDSLSYVYGNAGASRRDYVYTDRPIYRPGDTVHIKGISRIGFDGQYQADKGSTTVEIRDASYETAADLPVHMSVNGTYETSFIIDGKAPLGYYQISSGRGGYGSFQVEEYVAPQFKVAVSPDKEEYISGDTATLNISSDYYFGVPVASGDVDYRIVAQDYYFDRFTDGYFNFDGGWYNNDNGWYGDRYLTSGKLKLDKDGKGVLTQELNIDKLFSGSYKNKSKVITVYVTVKNENGQSVSTQHSLILHRGSFYAGMNMDEYFFGKGQQGEVKIKTVDIKGVPVSESNLSLSLDRLDWKSYKRQEVDGNFYYRTEQVKTHILSESIDTDKNGNGSYLFTAGEPGEYEFTLTGKDEKDNTITATYDIYVSGEKNVSVRPTNNASLELVSQQTSLSVGDTGKLVIKSPYAKAKALITLSRGKIFERKIVDITGTLTEYTFKVSEAEIPNITAEVLLLSPDPEVKYGSMEFSVGTKEKELSVAITPNKKSYLPGEQVTLSAIVTDSSGRPVQSELSLSVVDMSVLALVGNPHKNPVAFFYNHEPLSVRTSANVKNILTVAEIPTGTKGGSGGGGDDLEKKKRGVFRDTAYWEGIVNTDAMGRATISFTLPDNLTEWQAESVAITKDTKVGAGYGSFTSKKTVMAVPLKPRFILPGDSFSIGGTVFNESETVQTFEVSVTSPSLSFTGSNKVSLSVAPHTSVSTSFPVVAPEGMTDGSHAFTFSAKNETYEDVVDGSIPIERNETYESTVTAGRITEASWREQLYLPKNVVTDRGGLTISLSATMASVLDNAIRGMLIYPYECSEQTGSKLRTIALVKQNTNLFGTTTLLVPDVITMGDKSYTIEEVVGNGLAKLYENENPSGGVSYYKSMMPDYYLTLQTLETYIDLEKAGYQVDQSKKELAAQYVFNSINYPGSYPLGSESIIKGSYVLSRLGGKQWVNDAMTAKLRSYAANTDMVHRGLSSPALAYLAVLSDKYKFGFLTTNRLFAEFENRSVVDARGTTVGANNDSPSQSFENSIVNTSLALKAFSETKRDSALLEGYTRAIKQSRVRDGSWASTYNNITVIDAMTQFLVWKNEANAHMKVGVSIDGTAALGGEWNKSNILSVTATTVPMLAIKKGVTQNVNFTKENLGKQNDAYYYDMLLKYYLPADQIAPRDEGFAVERALYRRDDTEFKSPVTSATQGEVLHARAIIRVPSTRQHVSIEDFIPAGVEIVNQNFATEDPTIGNDRNADGTLGMTESNRSMPWYKRGLAQIFSSGSSALGPRTDTDGVVSDDMYASRSTTLEKLYPSATESHDDRVFAYVSYLEQGEYVYDYYVRALVPGTYQYLPMIVSELYTPEHFGRTSGSIFTVTKKD